VNIEDLRGQLILTILPFMAAEALVVILGWLACRRGFGGYIQKNHPDKWIELVPRFESIREFTLTLDVTPALRRFRRESVEDLGDGELRLRRKKANQLERTAILGFLALGGWFVLVIGAVAFVGM